MTEVTRDRVCLIYALMCNDVDVNVGVVIFSTMKKMCYHEERQNSFGGLLIRFLGGTGWRKKIKITSRWWILVRLM